MPTLASANRLERAAVLCSQITPPPAAVLQTPEPPAQRPQLEKAIALIDEANSEDPTRITVDGQSMPYRCAGLTS